MRSDLLNAPVYKFTGKIEHWVTTFYQGFWGLPADKEELWKGISGGDVFLFHGTYPADYIDDNDAGGGVIGVGVVGGFDTKNEPVWKEELLGGRDYPYLIYFDEMYWFGDTDDIRLAPVSEKDDVELIDDSYALSENILKIPEMRKKAGEQISPMGLMGEVKKIDALRPVLEARLRDLDADKRDTPSAVHSSKTDGEFVTSLPNSGTSSGLKSGERRQRGDSSSTSSDQESNDSQSSGGSRRERSGASNTEVTGDETEVNFVRDTKDSKRKNQEHERILDVFEDALTVVGFTVKETEYSDLIATRDDTHLLAEAKYIHEDNERDQVRYAIGQLAEYRYRDFRINTLNDEPLRFLVLSQHPTDSYEQFLKDLQSDGIYTVWVDGNTIKGLNESILVFRDLL